MSPLPRTLRLLSVALLGALATPLAAEASPVNAPDSTPPPSLKLSGFVVASYVYSNKTIAPNLIVDRLYDRYSNAFTINAAKVTLDRPFVATKLDAGAHVDLIFGQNAEVLHSTGPFWLGFDGDIEQAYVTLNIPTGNGSGVQFKVGKMVTLMGLEVIEDVANPNWSEGNLFNLVENFTSTGVELDFKPSSAVDVELRVDNGWDRVLVADGQKSFMGRIGITAAKTSLALLGYWGNQEPQTSHAPRYGVEGLLNQKFGKASLWVQGDWGKEKANAALPNPTADASWWAVSGWLATDLSATANLAVRGDYVNDTDGFRTSGVLGFPVSAGAAQKLWSLTGTLNMKTWANALVRPEVRYDHSNLVVFNDKPSQVSFALSVAYTF